MLRHRVHDCTMCTMCDSHRSPSLTVLKGLRPKVTFDEYLDMHEYQNIQTRMLGARAVTTDSQDQINISIMLGADSFPYRNITVDDTVYEQAVEALNSFFFIGIQEVYDFSGQCWIIAMLS